MTKRKMRERYGPWALIAGASEGIGRAIAEGLAAEGLNLLLVARRTGPLDAAAGELRRAHGVEVRTASLDLASPDLEGTLRALIEDLDVGLLVANACYSKVGPFLETPLEDKLRELDVNCRALLVMTATLAPRLVARGHGGILVMSSMAGFQGSAYVSTYASTKAFDTTLAEGLWAELRPHGVDVLACIAGATSTPAFEAATPEKKRGKAMPMTPDAVAREAIAHLHRGPVHVAGRVNRAVHRGTRLLSRRAATRFFSNATGGIYGEGRS
ncbi:MAG: SDR family NAD(P)-dependent oxidoreductase [Myxococcales bacterium]|nr:SDR family NAD(P)-dependent oxidoreductase [Myxococcales bacterium]